MTSELHSTLDARRRQLISELQTQGIRFEGEVVGAPARRGGAGPSDHRAITVLGTTVMVPVYTLASAGSPFTAEFGPEVGRAVLRRDGRQVGVISLPAPPRFYELTTEDGIPYWKLAQLHARDVLATTVLQTCIRYGDRARRCQFCAIGESLKAGRTIAHKTPEQLAEVAEAAVRLDGVRHMVLTTGTPAGGDRGARVLCESTRAIRERTPLPIQAQCEPPDDFVWFERLRAAGVDTLGMHLEAWDPDVRARVMPGKAEVPVAAYLTAYEAAVSVFGRGQVSSYLIAGLGDTVDGLLDACRQLIALGVYPFVVPLVPISGTMLERQPSPSAEFMRAVLTPLGAMLHEADLTSAKMRAGCGKCGACSPLSTFET